MAKTFTRLLPPVATALVLLAGGSVRGASPAADKPADPDFVHQHAVFDCTPRATGFAGPGCTLPLAAGPCGPGGGAC